MLNPKVAVFYLAFLPQFIGPHDPVLPKYLLLAGMPLRRGHACGWRRWLLSRLTHPPARYPLRALRRWLDGVCGAVLVGLGARLAFERR